MRPRHPDPQAPDADLLVWAYRHGLFPMAVPELGIIEWFSPDPRAVFLLDRFRVPDSVARVVAQGRFEIRTDTAYLEVMEECARPRDDGEGTWIDERIIAAYVELHDRGHAHSVEAWRDGRLVGGLYGVQLGGAFFGESMFVRPDRGGTDASKVCLVHLVERMRRRGMRLLDTQFRTDHLDRFGCVEIPREEYLERLADALSVEAEWGSATR